MELNRYKKKNHKTVGILLFTIVCVFLIVGVILYQTYAIYEVIKDKDLVNGEVEDPGDIYFAFYVDGKLQKEMPKKDSGYTLDEENSTCGVMGSIDSNIKPRLDRDTWSIVVEGVSTSRTKCNLEFKKTYDDQKIYDLSGNHYDGTLMEGTIVQQDNEGNLGIYFDGENDYVDVADLPDTINWADGFTVETEFKALSLNGWRRIYDFGNGPHADNILFVFGSLCNPTQTASCMATGSYNEQKNYGTYYKELDEVDQKVKIKIELNKLKDTYTEKISKNDIFINNSLYETEEITKNVTRTSNYLGKSNWQNENMYFGYIYSLKITDSKDNIILWYDF